MTNPVPTRDQLESPQKLLVTGITSPDDVAGDVASNATAAVELEHGDLKRRTARGALISITGQGAILALRTASMIVMARLLSPKDFGLFGMVSAFTGFLGLFKDAGLSMATVQSVSISEGQKSALFWINIAVGGILALICISVAPALVAFYHEPRLFWITAFSGAAFILNGAAAQHRAMLQRRMRFGTLVALEVIALLVSLLVGIGIAAAGYGYWSLVISAATLPTVYAMGVWLATGWIPSLPRWDSGLGSMLVYGATVTLNSVIVYIAYNAEKVLLGRFWGAEALGLYGRAYQLVNLPTDNLNSTVGAVAFPALARVQDEPTRLKGYFLKGYSLLLALVMPITAVCALFAEDIIRVALGPKWSEVVPIFRLLVPCIAVFTLINPFGWLLQASGRAQRSLWIALLIAPVVMLAYVLGLKHGPRGVAIGYSIAMMLLAGPVIVWASRGTSITLRDILLAIMRPLCSVAVAVAIAFLTRNIIGYIAFPLLRLTLASSLLFGTYVLVLLFVMKQKQVYLALLRGMGLWPFQTRNQSSVPSNGLPKA